MKTARQISRWLLQFLMLMGLCSSLHAKELNVLAVLSDGSPLQQTFVNAFRQSLPGNIQVTVLPRLEDFNAQTADLIVTVGVGAANWVAGKTNAPLLAAMIPSERYKELLEKRPRDGQTSAIYLDQPWARQVRMLHAALPLRNRIGVLYSVGTRLDLSALRSALLENHLSLSAQPMQGKQSLSSSLEAVLLDSEVLLAVPDSDIYNGNTIRNILLSSYRRGIPLIGFSQAYVRAGALCALFSTPEQLAAQAGAMTEAYVRTAQLPDAQFSSQYSIAVNQEVARTLGVTIMSAEALRLQIEKSSGGLR